MQKIACVFSFKMSSWVSCQKIVFNLHKAYQLNPDLELLNFNYSDDQPIPEISATAQKIFEANPDIIVIMDHKPHPLFLLQILLPLYKNKKKPRIIFHIFGDFTLYYSVWDKLSAFLSDFSVDFIVASDRQKHLIDKFLSPPLTSKVCPFPVERREFSYVPALRKTQRSEWGLKENDIAFVFTGRLSRQKRIHTVLKSFAEVLSRNPSSSAHLFLYGNTDHIGDNFVGKWELEGEYFRKIYKIYKSLPEKIQKRIHFMGGVPNSELKSVYQGADYLLNFSVHNDEDYGMSVAEAQCSGLPAILSDWGGLASFEHKSIPEATKFVPVSIGATNKLIHYQSVIESLTECLKNKSTVSRKKLSEEALSRFSIEAAHETLNQIVKNEPQVFENFSMFFNEVLHKIKFDSTPYLTTKKQINNLYRKIYSSYVRNT